MFILGFVFQIGSDGMKSAVRKAADFHTISFNYDQMAVVAVVKTEEVTVALRPISRYISYFFSAQQY